MKKTNHKYDIQYTRKCYSATSREGSRLIRENKLNFFFFSFFFNKFSLYFVEIIFKELKTSYFNCVKSLSMCKLQNSCCQVMQI